MEKTEKILSVSIEMETYLLIQIKGTVTTKTINHFVTFVSQ